MNRPAPVTVVIPIRGRPDFLAEAVASLAPDASLIAEAIVIEDGTRYVREADIEGLFPRLRLVRAGRIGRSAARNLGVAEATTELVAFLDADDVSLPGRMERQAAALAATPEAGLCFGLVEAIDNASRPLRWKTDVERSRFDSLVRRRADEVGLLVDCAVYTSATMVRRAAFQAVGGYHVDHDAYEDLDLYLRLARRAPLVPCPAPAVAQHRLHPGNTASDYLYAGSIRLAERHLRDGARGTARRLLLLREIDGYWGLGAFEKARQRTLAALLHEPSLLASAQFRRRLAGAALPAGALRELRRLHTGRDR